MPYVSQIPLVQRFNIPLIAIQVLLGSALAAVPLLTVCAFGRPANASKTANDFMRIGFTNDAGEVPTLISKGRKKKEGLEVWEFETHGLPLSRWLKKQDEIASALNREIVGIKEGKNKRRIIVEAVKPTALSSSIPWNDSHISSEDFRLALGVSHSDQVTADLTKTPHLLIGGSTGSGKTIMMLCLIHQCKAKGAQVYIADFKGGYDFPAKWKGTDFITDIEALRDCLGNLTKELEARKLAMSKMGVSENSGIANLGNRIIFACDEIAEVLDKTGLSKEQKAAVADIESKLATIARLGRAFSINLILGTQRPDAEVLTGQIKSNISFRVCGRADEVLSKIILDTTAASQIPKDAQGRFMLGDGTEFQAYYYQA